ncbi:hypothetical protein LY78DRAFT_462984 [Colletotrichum sublineola]|nr:hypothetical protein LY78DRAFT_462984 [Colletotrichum sublineola]
MLPKPVFEPTVRPVASFRRFSRPPLRSGWAASLHSRDDGSDETMTTLVGLNQPDRVIFLMVRAAPPGFPRWPRQKNNNKKRANVPIDAGCVMAAVYHVENATWPEPGRLGPAPRCKRSRGSMETKGLSFNSNQRDCESYWNYEKKQRFP